MSVSAVKHKRKRAVECTFTYASAARQFTAILEVVARCACMRVIKAICLMLVVTLKMFQMRVTHLAEMIRCLLLATSYVIRQRHVLINEINTMVMVITA